MTSALTLVFASGRTILENSGYSFSVDGQGFRLKRGEDEVHVDCGEYSAVFANFILSEAGVEGVSPFPLGFKAGSTPKGKLSSAAVNLPAPAQDTPYAKDVLAAELFCSLEVVPSNVGLAASKTAHMYRLATTSPSFSYMEFEPEQGVPSISLGVDGKPFYKAISLSSFKGVPEGTLPNVWAKHIEANGFYWNLDGAILYVTNLVAGRHSIPPNHVALGLDFKIDLHSQVATANVDVPIEVPSGQSVGLSLPVTGELWQTTFRQFVAKPCQATSDALRTHAIQKEVKGMKNAAAYRYKSSRNNKASTRIAQGFIGEDKASTYKAYLQRIVAEMGDYEQAQFIVFMKLEGQMRSAPPGPDGADRFYLNATS